QLSTDLQRLAIWEKVIEGYTEDEQLDIRFEFTRRMLYYVLHQPYEFKSRLTFCSVQLCYEIGLETGKLKKKDMVDDHDITLKIAQGGLFTFTVGWSAHCRT